MSNESDRPIVSYRAPAPVGPYPHARRAGDWLFLSGIGPREPGTNSIPGNVLDSAGNLVHYDIAAQCHAIFRNVHNILEDAGATWDQIIDVTVFLTNIKDDFATYNSQPGLAYPAISSNVVSVGAVWDGKSEAGP